MIRYLILGAVQGVSEFLPISSSGHLVIFQKLLQVAEADIGFDIILHLASLLAVLFFFRHELFLGLAAMLSGKLNKTQRKLILFVLVASLVTALIGFSFRSFFEKMFTSLDSVAVGLVLTGILLFLSRFKIGQARRNQEKLNIRDGILIGLAQGAAIAPGVSRSAFTISAAIFSGIERSLAVKLSFLLSIPAIIGAVFFKIQGLNSSHIESKLLLAAFFSAFAFSFFSLKILVFIARKARLHYFAYYCWGLAAIIFYLSSIKRI